MSCSGNRVPNRTLNIPPFKSRFRQSRSPRIFNIPGKIFAFLQDARPAEILYLEHLCYREIRKKYSDGNLGPGSYIKTHLACLCLSSLDRHICNSSDLYLPKNKSYSVLSSYDKEEVKFEGQRSFFCVLIKCNKISPREDSYRHSVPRVIRRFGCSCWEI